MGDYMQGHEKFEGRCDNCVPFCNHMQSEMAKLYDRLTAVSSANIELASYLSTHKSLDETSHREELSASAIELMVDLDDFVAVLETRWYG